MSVTEDGNSFREVEEGLGAVKYGSVQKNFTLLPGAVAREEYWTFSGSEVWKGEANGSEET